MAVINTLAKRQDCAYYGNCSYGYSSWDNWVRWVVLVIIIVLFLLFFFACSCATARRRRRMGQSPYYGTGWAARGYGPQNEQQPYYNNSQYPPPPPQYSTDVPVGHQGYYGPQTGIELQQPPNAYAPGRSGDDWQPPAGPPPKGASKNDGIIR